VVVDRVGCKCMSMQGWGGGVRGEANVAFSRSSSTGKHISPGGSGGDTFEHTATPAAIWLLSMCLKMLIDTQEG